MLSVSVESWRVELRSKVWSWMFGCPYNIPYRSYKAHSIASQAFTWHQNKYQLNNHEQVYHNGKQQHSQALGKSLHERRVVQTLVCQSPVLEKFQVIRRGLGGLASVVLVVLVEVACVAFAIQCGADGGLKTRKDSGTRSKRERGKEGYL